MKLRSFISAASITVALGSAAALLLRLPSSAPGSALQARSVERPSPSSDSSEGTRREQELEGLRQQVSRLAVDLQRVRTTVSNTSGLPVNADSVAPLSNEEQEQNWLAHVQTLDRAFRDEPIDGDWSQPMLQKIQREVASNGLTAGLVVDVQCRSRTCKLELAPAEPRRLEQAVNRMIQTLSADLQNAAIGHDGDLASPKPTALYLSRALPEDSVPLVARR